MPMRWFYGKGRYGVLPLKARMSTAALTEKKKSDVDVDDVKAGCNLVYSILSSSIAGAVCRQPARERVEEVLFPPLTGCGCLWGSVLL